MIAICLVFLLFVTPVFDYNLVMSETKYVEKTGVNASILYNHIAVAQLQQGNWGKRPLFHTSHWNKVARGAPVSPECVFERTCATIQTVCYGRCLINYGTGKGIPSTAMYGHVGRTGSGKSTVGKLYEAPS